MGYTLAIGELKVIYDNDPDCPCLVLDAELEGNGPVQAKKNRFTCSYSGMKEFCIAAGLYDLFFDEDKDDCLIGSQHPGCVPLTENHRTGINKAFEKYVAAQPDAVAAYEKLHLPPFHVPPRKLPETYYFIQLAWLHYWVNWALDNCKQPVFVNR